MDRVDSAIEIVKGSCILYCSGTVIHNVERLSSAANCTQFPIIVSG